MNVTLQPTASMVLMVVAVVLFAMAMDEHNYFLAAFNAFLFCVNFFLVLRVM